MLSLRRLKWIAAVCKGALSLRTPTSFGSLHLYSQSVLLSRNVEFRCYSTIPLLQSLVPTCNSCGITLQKTDPDRPGFYREPGSGQKLVRKENLVAANTYSGLDDDDLKLLLNSNGEEKDLSLFRHRNDPTPKPVPQSVQCIRCREAQFRSEYSQDEFPIESLDAIMASLPPDANLVYVVSAADFPMSLDLRVFLYRRASDILFVVTKCDLLFPTLNLANRYGLPFFQDYFYRKHGVLGENVVLASGKIDWNIPALLKAGKIRDNSYLIGSVNSGKSTLLKSMLTVSNNLAAKKERLSSRERTKLEKEQDRLINSQGSTPSDIRALRRKNEQEKNRTGPGASYMPGYTRGTIAYDVDGVTMHDVPGFGENVESNEFASLFSYLQPSQMKQLSKGVPTHKYGTYKSPFQTIKGGQCYTVGGMFYLVPPSGTMVQARNCINHKAHIFSNIDKAKALLEAVANEGEDGAHAGLRNVFIMPGSTLPKLVPRYIPAFYGAIDLVVAGAGHVNLTPTGAPGPADEPWVVWVPQGVRIWVRQPITRYTTRTLAGRDARGNPLRKELWKQKSVTHVERYTGKAPFYSRLSATPDNTMATKDNRYPGWYE